MYTSHSEKAEQRETAEHKTSGFENAVEAKRDRQTDRKVEDDDADRQPHSGIQRAAGNQVCVAEQNQKRHQHQEVRGIGPYQAREHKEADDGEGCVGKDGGPISCDDKCRVSRPDPK